MLGPAVPHTVIVISGRQVFHFFTRVPAKHLLLREAPNCPAMWLIVLFAAFLLLDSQSVGASRRGRSNALGVGS